MEVALEKSSATNALLKISLKEEDYQSEVTKKIKEYSGKVAMKGFRPGKVPVGIVKKMYGKSILIDEVNNLLSKTVADYIKENKLPVVGDPVPKRDENETIDFDRSTEFDFTFEIGMASDFEVDLSKVAPVKKYVIEAGEKELNDTIANLQTRFSEQFNPESSEVDDMIYGDLKQVSGGDFTTKTAIPTDKVKPEMQAVFVGLTKGSVVEFDLHSTFDEESIYLLTGLKKQADVPLIEGQFEFTVEDITRAGDSSLNQAFFDKVLGKDKATDEESFKKQVLEVVSENYVREATAKLRIDAENAVLDSLNIELPDQFLKDWLFRQNEGKFTMEQIEEEFEAFKKTLKLSLVKNKIAEAANLNVEYAEVLAESENQIRQQFGFYGNDLGEQMEATVRKIAQGYLADKERDNFRTTYNMVFDNKVAEYTNSQLVFEETPISVDDFQKMTKEA